MKNNSPYNEPKKDVKDIAVDVAKVGIRMAMTSDREEEEKLKEELIDTGIKSVAVDIGGSMVETIPTIIERAVVASKRSGVTKDCFSHDGSVAGATREAISQVYSKAAGLNIGGKISITSCRAHLTVAIFINIGILHLNEIVIGLGHRSI
ncbi:MAG: HutP family protein [Andreesenia angusta]|nr:HutP family protein [Andreesenia angusta]